MVTDTSRESYQKLQEEGKENVQERIVLEAIMQFKFPVCDAQIEDFTGLSISSVTARRNRLEQHGLIVLSHKGKSPRTGRKVQFWTADIYRGV